MENNTNIIVNQSSWAHSSLEESSSELLEFGLHWAWAFPLFTTSLKLSSSHKLGPKLGPTFKIQPGVIRRKAFTVDIVNLQLIFKNICVAGIQNIHLKRITVCYIGSFKNSLHFIKFQFWEFVLRKKWKKWTKKNIHFFPLNLILRRMTGTFSWIWILCSRTFQANYVCNLPTIHKNGSMKSLSNIFLFYSVI